MDVAIVILSAVLALVGLVGCFLPVLPGIPLCYVAMLMMHFTTQQCFTPAFLWMWLGITVVVQLFDYLIPIWGTRTFGGSKAGSISCTIGLILGLFFSPWGIVVCPFLCAFVAERVNGKEFMSALKASFGAFLGFLAGTVLKMVVACIMIYYLVCEAIVVFE